MIHRLFPPFLQNCNYSDKPSAPSTPIVLRDFYTWDLVHGRETIINDALGTDFSSPIKEGDKFNGYVVTSDYGEKRGDRIHKGIDIAMPVGTPIYFPFTKGSVECGKDDGGWGLYATITSANLADPVLLVGHLSQCAGGEYL